MLTSCLGYQTPAARSISPVVCEQSEDDQTAIDYTPAIKLEESTVCLQIAQHKALDEFIQILSKSSREFQKWKEQWYQTFVKHRNDKTGSAANWELFNASVLSVDVLIKQTETSIRELTTANNAVPKHQKEQSLKFKIKQARVPVVELTKELDALEEEKMKTERRIHRNESNSSATRVEELTERRKHLKTQLASKRKVLDKAQLRFARAQEKFYNESKRDEIERCEALRDQLEHFMKAMCIRSENFAEKSKRFNAETNLQRWEQDVFRRRRQQTCSTEQLDDDI